MERRQKMKKIYGTTSNVLIKIKYKSNQNQCHHLQDKLGIIKGEKKHNSYCSAPSKKVQITPI